MRKKFLLCQRSNQVFVIPAQAGIDCVGAGTAEAECIEQINALGDIE